MARTQLSNASAAVAAHPREAAAGDFAPRRAAKIAGFAGTLFLALPRGEAAEPSLHYKYQEYREESDRIKVVSHYALAEVDVGTATRLRARGVLDTITGATPTGVPAPANSGQVPLAALEDERRALVFDVTRTGENASLRFEYAYSDEDDYLSRGYATTLLRDFNQKNTQLQLGFSYIDDDVRPLFFPEARRKLSRDFIVGVTQLLDPNTTLTANVAYGRTSGFLSDPYKIVRKNIEVVPGVPLPLTFPENRPSHREKTIFYTQVLRWFEQPRASLDVSYRLLADDHGIDSDTVEVAWFQHVGANWVVRPLVRWYQQGAADYYFYDLDFTPIVPGTNPSGGAPHYSSDYRLSKFRAITWGLKVIYTVDDRWSVDAMFERYEMRGRDGVTPASAYATANTFTLGLKLWF